MTVALVVIVIVIALVFVVLIASRRTPASNDGVDDFRRHLDALSPEARQQVIDRVQHREEDDDGA
ncbi:MAG: hypothetical protein RL413_1151 [Actinomycetota bacterium]